MKSWNRLNPAKQLSGKAKLIVRFLFGLFLSFLLGYQVAPMSPLHAQIPNTASVQYDNPSGGGVVNRSSNTTQISDQVPTAATLEIQKTADKSAAEPGDVVLYRLLVRNLSNTTAATPLTVVDNLPLGLQFVENSVDSSPTPPNLTSVTVNQRQVTFQFDSLAAGETLQIVYAVTLSPDSVRGTGRNVATASAPGFDPVQADFRLAIRPGILSDCGTIIGRVFVDKNFDGFQQDGEPGVPNAVLFLDDGNRIITDPDGLFSLANVIAGFRVGVLDLNSLPGYTLAPNLYRIEDNSQSRLVRLEPGGLARMNFAVTPTYGEEQN